MTNAGTSAISGGAEALRDIKPPVEVPTGWEWLWWILTACALASLLYGAWRWRQGRKRAIVAAPSVPPHVRARQRLEEALALLSQPKPFCTAVSDTIRLYLEERFEFRAPERTTEEFLQELHKTELLLPEQKESLGDFLRRCDLVKFARYQPDEAELRELHGSALRLVEETEPQALDGAASATQSGAGLAEPPVSRRPS